MERHDRKIKPTVGSRQFEPGEKVRTEFGELRTVREQRGNQEFVVEKPDNPWYPAEQTNPDC
jgi:hypothetical protein